MTEPSYHDLYVTTAEIQRVRIHDLPANYMVTCHRAAGWELGCSTSAVCWQIRDTWADVSPGMWCRDGRSG